MREEVDFKDAVETFKFNDYVHLGALEKTSDVTMRFQVAVKGKEGTPFEGGSFTFTLDIPPNYPFRPPTIHCDTPVWHPLVDSSTPAGRANVLFYLYPESLQPRHYDEAIPEGWTPQRTLADIIQALINIMHLLPPHWTSLDCINNEARDQVIADYPAFEAKAKEWVTRFAKNDH